MTTYDVRPSRPSHFSYTTGHIYNFCTRSYCQRKPRNLFSVLPLKYLSVITDVLKSNIHCCPQYNKRNIEQFPGKLRATSSTERTTGTGRLSCFFKSFNRSRGDKVKVKLNILYVSFLTVDLSNGTKI